MISLNEMELKELWVGIYLNVFNANGIIIEPFNPMIIPEEDLEPAAANRWVSWKKQ